MEQREKLIELLSEHHSGNYDEAKRIADHLIANGVVVPVRCNDCKHFEEGKLKCRFHSTETQEIQMFPTWFCSEGERKGGDE